MSGNRQILLVDDEPLVSRILAFRLKRAGCDCKVVATGKDALDAALASAPDAIVLDLGLPDMSGLDVCRELKKDKELSDVPIIVLTGDLGANVQQDARNAGAAQVVLKTSDAQEIVETVVDAMSQIP